MIDLSTIRRDRAALEAELVALGVTKKGLTRNPLSGRIVDEVAKMVLEAPTTPREPPGACTSFGLCLLPQPGGSLVAVGAGEVLP